MSSRHQPEAGADSYDIEAASSDGLQDSPHWQDATCDYCGKTVYQGLLRQIRMAGSTSWLCQWCYARQRAREEAMS